MEPLFPIEPTKNNLETTSKIPEEVLWITNFTSKASKETYTIATKQFIQFCGIENPEQLRSINHGHVIGYRAYLEQEKKLSPRSINNRLSALSSLFDHLIQHNKAVVNPVRAVKRMKLNYYRVESKALSISQVRSMLNTCSTETITGLRNQTLLSILFFTGCRVSELCKLKLKDYYDEQGFQILDFQLKGGKRNRLAINTELKVLIDTYIKTVHETEDPERPLILPVKKHRSLDEIRHLSTRQVQRVWKKLSEACGIRGTTPHSARTTFITQALENNCPIDDVQKTVGHSQVRTTQTYDHRKMQFRKSASFAVRY